MLPCHYVTIKATRSGENTRIGKLYYRERIYIAINSSTYR